MSVAQETASQSSPGLHLRSACASGDVSDEHASQRALADRFNLEFIPDLRLWSPSADFVQHIPISFARQHEVLGLADDTVDNTSSCLRLAVPRVDQPTLEILQIVSRFLHRRVCPAIAASKAILAAIDSAYQERHGEAQTLIESMDRGEVLAQVQQLQGREDLLDVAARAPVIKLVNLLLFEAVKNRASDVHVQPYEERLVVRLRIDGVLFDSFDIPKPLQEEVVSRIKVMGRMDIAEKRLPQDGRATVQVGDRSVDLRIASLPTSFGERVVIRLLDKGARLYSLEELGMERDTMLRFRKLIQIEHGIILVTGPTGGGKTTTLYAAIQELNSKQCNILTLEDPIEYGLPGISQTQVSEKKGMNFASGLRSVLRQDPDIIMVGEIRDRETASMAIQSALTGHLVFSTLHTNDAASAVARLLDLGIEPYLLASSIVGVLAQRLVRRICSRCGVDDPKPQEQWHSMGLGIGHSHVARIGRGCEHCRQTGYSGRIGLFELLAIDDAVRQLIARCDTAAEIRSTGIAGGMKTLKDDGISKVNAGVTTLEEVLRVTSGAT